MRVTVDEEACVGAGQCVLAAPDVFDQREEDGVVILLQEEPPADLHEATKEAEVLCPALAIRLRS
ncbi:ferredoxin [Crossiella equi]|uniref:Ferredoxin n=1 Tax=Crossiella equi TaxID=130796 RepID=A0ABS5AN50_9PSEU|nr:ferredoxin [Crossiella equi]MBP2477997.1 ferredoxin [Crossiella equi]